MSDLFSPAEVTLLVTETLERLDVPYFVAGSLASIVHGMVRTTMDADIVADMRVEHVPPLVDALNDAFFMDAETLRNAISARQMANLIHRETMFKVDLYPARDDPFQRSELTRRVWQPLSADGLRGAYFATPEDTILAKLVWFRKGNDVSERQWRDVLGILKVQGERLDAGYMRRWASTLAVDDLLERAMVAARL